MHEEQAAQQLEHLIASQAPGVPIPAGLDADLQGRLEVAKHLAELDLARESRGPEWLRARLERGSQRLPPQSRPWPRRRPILSFGLGLGLLLVLMAVFTPRTFASLVQPVARIIDSLRVGAHTKILRAAKPTATEASQTLEAFRQQLTSGDTWFVSTPYGGFGGGVPKGEPAVVRETSSLDELRSLTSLEVPVPTYLHRGQPLRFDHASVAPGGWVFAFFGSGPNELLLSMAPVGHGRSVAFSRSRARTSPDGRVVFESPELETEEIDDGDRTATWDPDTMGGRTSALRWEEEGVSYALMGRSLTRDEAVAFFHALRPHAEG